MRGARRVVYKSIARELEPDRQLIVEETTAPAAPLARRRALSDPSVLAFAFLLILGVVLALVFTRGLSFFADDWEFIVGRRGVSAEVLLRPHGPHLSLIPILIYKTLLKVFGGSSYFPFRVVAAFDVAVLAGVLGWVSRRWWGRWWGLVPVLLFVTLGPASSSLLWSFQSGYAIALATGLVALVTADDGGRRNDVIACVALIISLASGSQGIGFVVGVAVIVALAPGWRRRVWVIAVPAVLYALWYLKYGHQASETHLSLWTTSLRYGFDSLSATFAPLLGLSKASSVGVIDIRYGAPLALGVLGAVGYLLWRGWRPPRLFWASATSLVVLWLAASLSNWGIFTRPPTALRYLETNAYLVLVCLLTAVPRPNLRRGAIAVVGLILAAIALTNASQYSQGRQFMNASDIYSRAELGALRIMRGVVSPSFLPETTEFPAVLVGVDAQNFFSAEDSFGLISDTPTQIAQQSEAVKETVDNELGRGELSFTRSSAPLRPVPLTPVSGTPGRSNGCLTLGAGAIAIQAPPGRYVVRSGSTPVSVAMARFATNYSVILGKMPAHSTYVASVPSDRDQRTLWRMNLSGAGGRACSAVP